MPWCAVVLDDLEQRRDLLGHPRPDRRLVVVVALDEVGAVDVADAIDRGRVGDEVVDVAVGGADPAAGHPRDEVLERHVDVAGEVDPPAGLGQRLVEGLGLDLRPREAVEDRPVDGVGRLETVEEDPDDGRVRHELAAAHVPVGLAPERRPGRDRRRAAGRRRSTGTPDAREDRRLGPLARARERPGETRTSRDRHHRMNPS